MKTERYYDVGCNECGRHLSTDFSAGMLPTRVAAEHRAKKEGFRVVDGHTLCPLCVANAKKAKQETEH